MDRRTVWGAESTAAVEAVAASVTVLAGLAASAGADSSDPLRDLADGCLDGLAEVARLEARTAALKASLAEDYARAATALAPPPGSPAEATTRDLALLAEIACVLTISERTAGALLADAQALATNLPLTRAALRSGTISWQHARIIIDQSHTLDPDGAAALEAHFLDPHAPHPARGCPAGDLVPARFRAKARTWRERHHPASIEERHTKSAADRRIEYHPDTDGMAWLSAYLPATTAAGIWNRCTAAARALQNPHEPRTLTQLRADITATWLLTNNTTNNNNSHLPDRIADIDDGGSLPGGMVDGGVVAPGGMVDGGVVAPGGMVDGGVVAPGGMVDDGVGMPGGVVGGIDDGAGAGVPFPRAQVLVTVPVLSLLGATEEPAMLDGYGPIPPSMARTLIAEGADSFHRVLTDPRDGAPLEIGRTSYRLTKAMRQWLRLRDAKCPFPGCNNHSLDNDADHLLAWADGGTTGITNLGQPCPKHHRLKHTTAWTPTPASKNHPPGWTSPTGRHYPSEHQDWEPPHWPHHTPTTTTNTHMAALTPPDHPEPPPDTDPELDLPPDLDLFQERELPVDPFPDWSSFTAAHPWPDTLDVPDEPTTRTTQTGPCPNTTPTPHTPPTKTTNPPNNPKRQHQPAATAHPRDRGPLLLSKPGC
ncbi:HNH endonuclease signature motif containing protein [Arthrobacter alkaliphilus]